MVTNTAKNSTKCIEVHGVTFRSDIRAIAKQRKATENEVKAGAARSVYGTGPHAFVDPTPLGRCADGGDT